MAKKTSKKRERASEPEIVTRTYVTNEEDAVPDVGEKVLQGEPEKGKRNKEKKKKKKRKTSGDVTKKKKKVNF